MSNFELKATTRADQGKGASRRLRRERKIPAIIYGTSEPQSIAVDANDLYRAIEDERFFSSKITLDVEGTATPVIIKDLQRHPAKPLVLHADFQRIAEDQKIKIQVPLNVINFEKSPAGKASAKFAMESKTVEILCNPANLPEKLDVDLGAIEMSEIAHLSDIILPEGVEIVALRRGEDHDQSIGYCFSTRATKAAAEA